MIRHILIAAWRNMAANKLLSAIAIGGLAIGIAAALLAALVVQNQMTFDHFIPGHKRTYRFFWWLDPETTQCSTDMQCGPPVDTAAELQRYPAVESIARLFPVALSKVQHGPVTGWERYAAVDPTFFAVVPVPLAYGRLEDALARPDGVVITRAIARKYFGHDDAVGQGLTIHGYKLAVRAVIEDLPRNATNIQNAIFVAWNDLLRIDPQSRRRINSPLYLRLKPGASLTDAQAADAMRHTPDLRRMKSAGQANYFAPVRLLPLDRVNLWEPFNRGVRLRLAAAALTGALVLLIAAINFVNLMVAQAARREKEVGVRKANGGGRGALMLQFLGEAVVRVGIAAMIGVALAEWLLSFVNAFLDTSAVLTWNDPLLLAALPAAVALLALSVGFWPAFVLSGFRPASVLRRALGGSRHAMLIRGVLVTLQFSILVTLAIAGAVMWLQRDFAAREALRVDSDQMLLMKLGPVFAKFRTGSATEQAEFRRQPFPARTRFCPPGFIDNVRKLPGVRGAVCTDDWMIAGDRPANAWETKSGGLVLAQGYSVDPRLFALYGIRPLAGILPRTTDSEDVARATGTVINLAAMRKLGFASPQAALGQNWIGAVKDMSTETRKMWTDRYGPHAVITAVVPDFSFGSVRSTIPPTFYSPWTLASGSMVHIKLSGRDIPETLAAIDHIYAQSGIDAPLDRVFLDDYMQALYRDMTRDANFFAGTAAIAILLACVGLFGIAVSTAERRTKEIGIRKAMGAGTGQIVALLLWQFAQPVLWANVIAWPVAWWLMRRWLSGFAYHIDLHWWVFAGASLGALAIALLTVAGQAFLTARQKPVLALRYE